jgi:hypothetical protein
MFYGNFYHATATLDGTRILIRSNAPVQPGKTLFLKLK